MTWSASDRQLRVSLHAEWAELVKSGQLDWWPDDDGGGGGSSGALAVLERCREHDDEAWQLVLRTAQSGQVGAAHLALEALLAALARMAARDRYRPLADYVSAAWLRIYDHPIERRPRRVSTNLVLDTLKALTRERDSRTHPRPPDWFDEPHLADDERAGERADSLITAATRLGVISPASAPVLRSVYADGLSGRQAAARHRESHEMVRYRCSRSVRQMRAARAVLREAA